MIHHLETGILTHGLNFTDDFIYEAFLNQLFRKVGIQNNRHVIIFLGYIAFLPGHFD